MDPSPWGQANNKAGRDVVMVTVSLTPGLRGFSSSEMVISSVPRIVKHWCKGKVENKSQQKILHLFIQWTLGAEFLP